MYRSVAEKIRSVMDKFLESNFSAYRSNKAIFLLAGVGLLLSLALLITLPFKDSLYNLLYPKEASKAEDVVSDLTAQLLLAKDEYDQAVLEAAPATVSPPEAFSPTTSPTETTSITETPTPSQIVSPTLTPTSEPSMTPQPTTTAPTEQASPSGIVMAAKSEKVENHPNVREKHQKIKDLAKRRKEELLKLASTNPQAFLDKASLTSQRDTFPKDVQDDIEEQATLEGTYYEYHTDNIDVHQPSTKHYTIKGEKPKKIYYEIKFAALDKNGPGIKDAISVAASGIKLETTLVVKDAASVKTASNSEVKAATSPVNLLVVMFNFNDYQAKPFTANDLTSLIFDQNQNSANKYYLTNSFNQFYWNGTVHPSYITIPASIFDCKVKTVLNSWLPQLRSLAQSQVPNYSSYQKVLYVFPFLSECLATPNPAWTGVAFSGESAAFISTSALDSGFVLRTTHELGHLLNLAHSSATDCSNPSWSCIALGNEDQRDTSANLSLYYTQATVQNNFEFSGAHKVALGWIGAERVAASGQYLLAPTEVSGVSLPKVLIVTKTGSNLMQLANYYLEFRQPIGYDAGLPSSMTDGASIRVWNGDGLVSTGLIDVRSPGYQFKAPTSLTDGSYFYDSAERILIKQIGKELIDASKPDSPTNRAVRIEVTYNADPPSPAVTPQPSFDCTTTVSINNNMVTASVSPILDGKDAVGWNVDNKVDITTTVSGSFTKDVSQFTNGGHIIYGMQFSSTGGTASYVKCKPAGFEIGSGNSFTLLQLNSDLAPPWCTPACGQVGQSCCYGQNAYTCGNKDGSRCVSGTCSNPAGGGICSESITRPSNCQCGDGFYDNNNNGTWDSNEHGAACCGDWWRESNGATSGCEDQIPAYRDSIQGLVCQSPGGDRVIRFVVKGNVFIDDNRDGIWQGACGTVQRTPNGSICLGQSCSNDEDCRTGYCCTGINCPYGKVCTNADSSIAPSGSEVGYEMARLNYQSGTGQTKTVYTQSLGSYEVTGINNSYTSHKVTLTVPSTYQATTPTSQTYTVSSGQYESGPLSRVDFGIAPIYVTTGGYIKDKNTGAGIAGVQVGVQNSRNFIVYAATDASGLWKVSGFIRKSETYAVKVTNIKVGYETLAKTAYFRAGWPYGHVGWSLKDVNNNGIQDTGELDTVIGEQAYTYQTAGLGNDCAGADDTGTTLRCSFSLTSIPSSTKRVFVTSSTYFSNLGGLTGADNICRSLAQAKGMTQYDWKAWLSTDASNNPLSRFSNSTQYRTNTVFKLLNGNTFATNWTNLTSIFLVNPININENSQAVPISNVWTNTHPSGNTIYATRNCTNWTGVGSETIRAGKTGEVSARWSDDSSANCSNLELRLYCFEQEGAFQTPPPMPTPTPTPVSVSSLRVFMTKNVYTPTQIGGVAGAKTICQGIANSKGFGGTWDAWLSDSSSSPSIRFSSRTRGTLPFVLLNGLPIANNWLDLTDGTLLNMINLDEDKTAYPAVRYNWTNTRRDGTIALASTSPTCSNWTSANGPYNGKVGDHTRFTSSNWTDSTYKSCAEAHPLYCFEQ